MEPKRVETCVTIQAETQSNRSPHQTGERRPGLPADLAPKEIADERLTLLLAKTRNRGAVLSKHADPHLAAGSTVCVQMQPSSRKQQRFREQVAGSRVRRLSEQPMTQELDATDAAHVGTPLPLSVTHVETTIVHPDLISSGYHPRTHVDHAAVEGPFPTRTQERRPVGSVPTDAVAAGCELDLEVVAIVVVGGWKEQVDALGEGIGPGS